MVGSRGARHWRSDSVFYGSPQWQIESMRRLEIPDDIFAKSKEYEKEGVLRNNAF